VLSPALQVEVILHVHQQWLASTWFLKGLESSCLVRLAREMTVQTLAPGEVAPIHNLYVVTRGLILYGGRVLSRGMAWGDDVILSDKRYYLPFTARALTYADVMVLGRDTLMQVMNIFPDSAAMLRKKVVRLALRRHVVHAKKKRENAHPAGSSTTRFALLDHLSGVWEPEVRTEEGVGAEDGNGAPRPPSPPTSTSRTPSTSRGKPNMCIKGWQKARLGQKLTHLEKAHKDSTARDQMIASRSSAVELALLLSDKQISQSEWRGANNGGNDQVAGMAHSEIISLLTAINDKVERLQRDVAVLKGGSQAATSCAPAAGSSSAAGCTSAAGSPSEAGSSSIAGPLSIADSPSAAGCSSEAGS